MSNRGVWALMFVITGIGLFVLFSAVNLGRPPGGAASTALVFDVPAELEETETPFRALASGLLPWGRSTVYQVTEGLQRAADDHRVASLVIHVRRVDWGWAKLAEVRDAILRVRAAGKRVYASLDGGGEAEYYLASAADLVAAAPGAMLQLDGLTASVMFLRGTFDKVGIRPNFAQAGRFKSGAEPYTRTGMSDDMREALQAVLADEYALLVDSLARARGMTPDSVDRLLDRGPYDAEGALGVGLIDAILHATDVDSLAAAPHGRRLSTLSFKRYLARSSEPRPSGPRIALVTASGTIVPGRSRIVPGEGMTLGSETTVEALRQARTRDAIKAVVLRIDSPGGSITASDDVWREVRRCREAKPVVVSMSDLAASGGYYIAAAADRIVAQPSTLTGSIGVYGGKLNVLGLYRKLGLNVETLARGRSAEMMSPFSDFTPDEARRYRGHLERSYDLFLSRVAEGRGMTSAAVESAGQGRLWSGRAARALGLVDSLGGLGTAFAIALEEAGYAADEGFVVERLPKIPQPFLGRLLEDWLGDDDASLGTGLPAALEVLLAAARFPAGAALALLPFSVEIR